MIHNLKIYSLLIVLGASLMAVGCDDSDSVDEPDEVYEAELSALNEDASYEAVEGRVEITTNDDQLVVTVNASGLEPNMIHPQHIHTAGSCPTSEADENGDGYVDVIEGVPAYGEIFVPLDDEITNLSPQTSFPNPQNDEGEISYSQTISIDALQNSVDGDLNLNGRHVVLHGVSSETDLPESVQTLGDNPAHLTLPVACGELTQMD